MRPDERAPFMTTVMPPMAAAPSRRGRHVRPNRRHRPPRRIRRRSQYFVSVPRASLSHSLDPVFTRPRPLADLARDRAEVWPDLTTCQPQTSSRTPSNKPRRIEQEAADVSCDAPQASMGGKTALHVAPGHVEGDVQRAIRVTANVVRRAWRHGGWLLFDSNPDCRNLAGPVVPALDRSLVNPLSFPCFLPTGPGGGGLCGRQTE